MATARYEPNERGLAALAHSPQLRSVLAEVAEKAKAYAESISPRETGEYAASFEVTAVSVTVAARSRAAAELANTAPYAAAVEWGNNSNGHTNHRVLGRTLEVLRTVT